jgi:hypothetical protein
MILALPQPGLILADSPGLQPQLAPHGVQVIPPWSPQADCLFARGLTPDERARRFRASGVRHIVLTKSASHLEFFKHHAAWERPPFLLRLVAENPQVAVFELRLAHE